MTEKRCQKKCKLDKLTQTCLGCERTLEEIIDAGKRAGYQTQEKDAGEGTQEANDMEIDPTASSTGEPFEASPRLRDDASGA